MYYCSDGLLVCLDNSIDIFWSASSSFYFEYPYTGIHQFVDEADSLQVLRTHEVFVVHLYLVARLSIGEDVRTTAYLYALTAVGRAIGIGKTHIALARYCHAQSSVAKHLNAYQLTAWTSDVLLLYLSVYLRHLIHVEFSGQYHHVGKLGIEAQGLDVGDVELSREMHLHALLSAVSHNRYIAGYHRRDASLACRIYDGAHGVEILAIYYGIYGEVRFYIVFVADSSNLLQVVNGEVVGGVRSHVELSDAEVHRVGTSLDGCRQ